MRADLRSLPLVGEQVDDIAGAAKRVLATRGQQVADVAQDTWGHVSHVAADRSHALTAQISEGLERTGLRTPPKRCSRWRWVLAIAVVGAVVAVVVKRRADDRRNASDRRASGQVV